MPLLRSNIAVTICLWVLASLAHGQTPRAWLRFDGTLTDSSGAGIVTSVTPSSGFTPTYAADRNGVASRALVFTGGQSLELIASSLVGNSNQALGLRNAGGTNTSFTLMAWIYVPSFSGQGYNTVFGNAGSGTGTLHAGLNVNDDNTHFGFDSNDVNGGACSLATNQWYHLAFVYDTTASNGQRVYVNGVPDVTRTSVTNTLKQANLLIGNWGTTTDTSNDFKGRLDDVVVYNTALKGDQIMAIYNGTLPNAVPTAGTYFAPATTYGYRGTAGMWGVREIKGYPGIGLNSLVNLDRTFKAHATTPGGTVVSYWTPMINFSDDEYPGVLGYFANEGDFGTNTAADDNNIALLGRCTVKIPTAGSYTFGFRGDDGSRLRVVGRNFASSTRVNGGNDANPAHIGDTLYYPNTAGDSATLGVVSLPAGEVDLEFCYFESTGGSSIEVFAAAGSKTSVDDAFQLIGNVAAGGLEIVRDSDTIPTFTVNDGATLFKHSGSPSTMTLAWNVNESNTTLSINQGIGTVARTGSTTIATPAATTTYTITATTGADVVTRSVTVYVNTAPVISSLTVSDATVTPGTATTLNWDVAGATTLTLNPGNINVTGTNSRVVNPTSTTTYTLTATNVAGSSQANIVVEVGTAPVITSFITTDASPVYGKETSLSWNVTGADTVSLNQNIGTVSSSGSVFVVPYLTTTYTLTTVNVYGSTMANVTINMPAPIGVNASGFTARRVSSTTPFPFTGQGYLQSALSLLGGQNAGATTTTSNYTTINFADGADGDFTSGNVAFPGGSGDNFAVEITGTLIINVPGTYDFIVNSDDGCRLRIDGVDVIVDDATHSPSATSGRYTFTKPTAQVQLVYYDAIGGASCEMAWVRPNLSWQQIGVVAAATPIVRGGLVINEFVGNGSTLTDEDGATQDWIEIWNSSNAAVNLAGHYLSNNAASPAQWAFPSKVLAPNEYLVVFASSKNRTNPAANLHTSFNIPGGGGYLALKKDDGAGGYLTLTEFNPFPALVSGGSYGSSDTEGYVGFIETPTPGAPNAETYAGFIQPVAFGTPRGRYSSAFNLTLTCATPDVTIRYTTDGSQPSISHGSIYTGPVNIASTTVFRAVAVRAGWKASAVETHSYLFIDDIVNQSAASAIAQGWPVLSVNGQVYRYGMALPNVTAGGGDLNALKNALAAAPSVCLNLNPADFHHTSTGIYSNPSKRGRFWERESSLEIIEPDGSTATQIDCGVRIRGNASRSTSNPKHAFHLYFRSIYGDGDLIYPLFGAEGSVRRFDQIDMRCEQNHSWSYGNSTNNALMREEFARKSQGDIGQPYSRSAYFHLYINGIYWGVFNWQEKTEADYAANQFGGTDSDYDTAKSAGSSGSYNTEMTDGNFIAWRQLFDLCLQLKNAATESTRTSLYLQMRGLNPDGGRNVNYPVLLDADNLIDYQLITFYAGSHDGPMYVGNASNNWFAVRNRLTNDRGFMFFCHDYEHSMGTSTSCYNRVGPWGDMDATSNNWGQTWTTSNYRNRETFTKFNPHYLHEFLCYSSEYRQRVQDRAQKHLLSSGGALTQAAALARADGLSAKIDPIIHAEAARWGSLTLHKNTWFNTGRANVYNWLNNGGTAPAGETSWTARARNLLVIEQLKGYTDNGAKPLASSITAPVFSGQPGGNVDGPYTFTITNAHGSGVLYYTLDGTDPRNIGGSIAGAAQVGASPVSITLSLATTVRARVYLSGTAEWSPLTEATYIVSATPASSANLVVTKLHYNPGSSVGNAEYVELMNISSSPINLTSCGFTIGITFAFPANYLLNPGARCVIVQNITAFNAAFPGMAPLIAGQYSGSLDNGGEQLLIVNNVTGSAVIIKDFTYDDASPWPTAPDGNGPALVLIRPETNPDHGNGANWRPSTTNGGAPGTADSYGYALWNSSTNAADPTGTGDTDHDGLPNLMEYALGTPPTANNGSGLVTGTTNIATQDYFTLTCIRPMGRDDVVFSVEASIDLAVWSAATLISRTPNYTTGQETLIYRHPNAMSVDGRQFLRAKAIKLP